MQRNFSTASKVNKLKQQRNNSYKTRFAFSFFAFWVLPTSHFFRNKKALFGPLIRLAVWTKRNAVFCLWQVCKSIHLSSVCAWLIVRVQGCVCKGMNCVFNCYNYFIKSPISCLSGRRKRWTKCLSSLLKNKILFVCLNLMGFAAWMVKIDQKTAFLDHSSFLSSFT